MHGRPVTLHLESFPLDRMDDAYEEFAHGTTTGTLKVVLHR
ncbi:hypothetical protein [Streptomyces sp. DSM 15324]|nr:hypothetical protein [Streptomyces sp. DSM 15324]